MAGCDTCGERKKDRDLENSNQQVESTDVVREAKIDQGDSIRSIIQMICNADR